MKNKKLLLLPLLAMVLAACTPTPSVSEGSSADVSVSEPGSDDPSSDDPSVTPPSSEEVVSSSQTPSSSEVPSVPSSSEEDIDVDEFYLAAPGHNYDNRALDHANGLTALNSLGEQKLLVVPVVFSNAKNHATEERHEMLQKVFFGASDDTGWESVASYYHKSSFGRLTLGGEVMPYFDLPYSTSEFLNFEISDRQEFGNPDNYWDETHHIIRDVYNTYDAETLQEYDLDGDGHVDALWLVYMYPHNESPFWAYKFYWNQEPDVNKPTPNVYAWASYDFANEGKGYSWANPDGHTFIHETGHLFGLNDYYDYDNGAAPTGQVDMMDHNVGDHNIYSKYLLNWSEPHVVTGNADITLRPSESSGDFILLKDGWNGHAYDNYILMEYYTPTGLNTKDSEGSGYMSKDSNSGTKTFIDSGVRMWHVDSRVVRFDEEGYSWVDEIAPADEESYPYLGPTNTTESRRRIEEPFKQLHLMDAKGTTSKIGNWLKTPTSAGNTALFKEGKKILATDWGKYIQNAAVGGVRPSILNDGTSLDYHVTIGEMTEEGVTIHIRKA